MRRAARWLGWGVGVLCLAAVVVDAGVFGSFISGDDGGGSGGFLAPASAQSAGAGVITASHHIRPNGSCRYGQWSNGNCRACPSGQVWRERARLYKGSQPDFVFFGQYLRSRPGVPSEQTSHYYNDSGGYDNPTHHNNPTIRYHNNNYAGEFLRRQPPPVRWDVSGLPQSG